jgi:hypothetical protein
MPKNGANFGVSSFSMAAMRSTVLTELFKWTTAAVNRVGLMGNASCGDGVKLRTALHRRLVGSNCA